MDKTSGFETSLSGSLLSALVGMAETMGVLKEARHLDRRQIGDLHHRVTALERQVSTISSSPSAATTPRKSGLAATLRKWQHRLSFAEPLGKLIIWIAPRALIAWGLAQGWLLAAWRWASALF